MTQFTCVDLTLPAEWRYFSSAFQPIDLFVCLNFERANFPLSCVNGPPSVLPNTVGSRHPFSAPFPTPTPPFFSQKSLLSAGAWVKSLAIWLDDVATFFLFFQRFVFIFDLVFVFWRIFFFFGDKFPLLRAGHSAGFILSFSCRLLFYFFFFNWSGIWQLSYLFIRWEIA